MLDVLDFLIRVGKADASEEMLILETKGYDPLQDVKAAAAERWVNPVNADGTFGRWHYRLVKKMGDTNGVVADVARGTGA